MMPKYVPIDWKTIRDALYDWYSDQTGLCTIWGNQDIPQPEYPFGTLTLISGPIRVGGIDEERWVTDLSKTGEEVDIQTGGHRTIVVSFQVRAGKCDAHDWGNDAISILSGVQSSLGLPSVRQTLYDAGLAVWDEGDIVQGDVAIEDAFISIANLDVTFGLTACIEDRGDTAGTGDAERVGYIDKVEISSDSEGLEMDFIVDAS